MSTYANNEFDECVIKLPQLVNMRIASNEKRPLNNTHTDTNTQIFFIVDLNGEKTWKEIKKHAHQTPNLINQSKCNSLVEIIFFLVRDAVNLWMRSPLCWSTTSTRAALFERGKIKCDAPIHCFVSICNRMLLVLFAENFIVHYAFWTTYCMHSWPM